MMMMLREFLVLALVLAIVNVSRSSEMTNSDVLNKKLLPSVNHLLKDHNDGNRQKFLRLLSQVDVDGYKFVDGEYGNSPEASD